MLPGATALCYTAPSSRLLNPVSPQIWRQSVQVDNHHLCPGMVLNLVYDVVDPGDDEVGAFPARLQLGQFFCPSGTAVQPYPVAYLKTNQVGQLVIACLHLFAGHFQVLAGKMGNIVVVPQGRRYNLSSIVSRLGEPQTLGRRASEAPSRIPCWQASPLWSHGLTLGRPAERWVASHPSSVGEFLKCSSIVFT